jgi:hypothetical protein
MSVRVMSWVWDNGPTSAADRLVMLALADFCDDAGRCFPSVCRIGEKACMTERGARKVLRRLETEGWIETKIGGGRHGCSEYRLLMEAKNPEQYTGNAVPGFWETRNQSAQNPEPECTKPGTTVPPNHQEPSKNRQSKDAREARANLITVLRPETADAFIEHRKAKRAKLTPHAANLIAKKLADHPEPDAVVEQSIMNGWTGVFPEKTKPRSQSHDGTSATDIAKRAGERWAARAMDSGPGSDPSEPLFRPRLIPGGSGSGD